MKISEHFSLAEFTKSQTAIRKGIDNTPSDVHINNLTLVAENILEPIRKNFDRPVVITSGYRSVSLCAAIGSSKFSQHALGQAVDFEIPGVDNYITAAYIYENLPFDQLILEFYEAGEPSSGWVHCSYTTVNSRRTALIYDGKEYRDFTEATILTA